MDCEFDSDDVSVCEGDPDSLDVIVLLREGDCDVDGVSDGVCVHDPDKEADNDIVEVMEAVDDIESDWVGVLVRDAVCVMLPLFD